MSATEDDTELRDLLIQNLENNGVLNKLKAEMRAAVFLAMEEQDKLEVTVHNKTPLINENLKKCLNTKDGRLVASLILDFLQVFNLDFTLAVFQPEINSLNGLDSRDLVCRELDLSESEVNRNSPLLLELVRRGRHKQAEGDRRAHVLKEPSQRQISHARKKFDFYDKDGRGSVAKEDLKSVFTDLIPGLNRNMLERFITDELRAADKTFSKTIDFQVFLGFYRRLFAQCSSVVVQDSDVGPEEKSCSAPASKIPRFKGQSHRGQSQTAAQDSEVVASLGQGDVQQQGPGRSQAPDSRTSSSSTKREGADQDLEVEDDPDDGDSFFDDPLPKPQKTYGWKAEASGARGSPSGSRSEAQRPGGGGGGSSEQSHSRNAAPDSRDGGSRDGGSRDQRAPSDRSGSLQLDEDVEYDDDFTSHRSDVSKSELSIGEEIEEVSIEGPDHSDKLDDTTQDLSVSTLSQTHGVDYMEEVA